MATGNPLTHPYIPNSAPQARKEMMEELGIQNIDALFSAIPAALRFPRELDLPKPLLAEHDLRRHVSGLLARNTSTDEYLSFLGAGCYHHYVPAVCDDINQRSEFLTAYSGRAYEDHGRWQALFEYASLMGELLDMDVVNLPTYDGYQAAATAMRMAANVTGRREIVIAGAIHPDKLSKIREYNGRILSLKTTGYERQTGRLDLRQLEQAVSSATAALYFESPNFFGVIEEYGQQAADLAHRHGALCVVSADPISLGVLKPPADYGADLACGDIQSLGMHMQFGGGQAGYIASPDEEKYVAEYPNRICGLVPTKIPGEYGFGEVSFERTSFMQRENGREWVGTMANLWAITAGVYLALMGPKGMREVGEAILSRGRYAMHRLARINGVSIPYGQSANFREFVLDFSGTGKTVAEINRALLGRGIFGGYDLSGRFPGSENHCLFCVTEVHSKVDIDRLANALGEVLE